MTIRFPQAKGSGKPVRNGGLMYSGVCGRFKESHSFHKEFSTMNCPHCGVEIGGRKCSSCGSSILEESLFCHRCGAKLNNPVPEAPALPDDGPPDFSKRVLCSDGNCIGVINEQGFCKICGKPYTGEPS
jgi:hypothetical protein